MGHKIFVSYKYHDTDVASLTNWRTITKCRDYVDYIEEHIIGPSGNIYKGEERDEDLTGKGEPYIWEHLKDKIYDTTLTIVLISPNMKEPNKPQESQWIPWEISYSLRETTRKDRTSHNNALLAVVIPDISGHYSYYYDHYHYYKDKSFDILRACLKSIYFKNSMI